MERQEDQTKTQTEPDLQAFDDSTQPFQHQSLQTRGEEKSPKTSPENDEDENNHINPPDSVKEQRECDQTAIALRRARQENNTQLMTELAEKIKNDFLKNKRFPLEQILNTDIIENIIKFLRDDKDQDKTLICAFLGVLAQIAPAMGVLVERFSKLGMIKIASEFLQHKDFGVNESALAFLSNIFLTNFVYREKIIQEEYENIMKFIVAKCGSPVSVSFDTQLSVFLTSLFRGPPYLDLEKLEPLLPTVQELLFRKEGSREIALNTLICLGGFCATAAEYEIGKLFGLDCLKSVLAFLEKSREDWEIAEWASRVIGTLSDKQYVELLDFGLVEKVGDLLEHNEKKVKKNAAWTISNILVSGRQCTEAIFEFQEGKIIRRLFQMIQTEEFTVKKIELIFF